MFKRLRQSLTLQFVVLSFAVYFSLSALGLLLFHFDLTQSLDEELKQVLAVTREMVLYDGQAPYLTTYTTDSHTVHLAVVIHLWDINKHLCGSIGVPGPAVFAERPIEVRWRGRTWRCLARPIVRSGNLIGYVQVEAPTVDRDLAVKKLWQRSLLLAPFLFFGLAACGYAFSGRAIKPVQHTYDLQKRFLADAGHELKTPISTMLVALDNLTYDYAHDEQSVERIDKVRRAARRMNKLVFDLILLTKTEEYSEPLATTPVQLDMLLREVMGELEELFESKNITLIDSQLDSVQVTGNRDSLYTVFANLIKNALQYTNSGGSVTVTIISLGEAAIVKVVDTGVGISPEDIDKVFERFYRADFSRSGTRSGSGLGLAIAKAMIERHHGTISVRSELGKGTTFMVTLPIAQNMA